MYVDRARTGLGSVVQKRWKARQIQSLDSLVGMPIEWIR